MHGVSAMVQETPELITKTLNQVEQCLDKIHHKPAYDMAIAIQEDYVRDPKLRLMFLRADRFDPELAAKRLIRFLDWKLKLFGRDKLCQWHITIEDLDDDARFILESGIFQILPSRDSRGRMISIVSPNDQMRLLQRTTQSTLQMVFYTLMCATEDETNQKMGMVNIVYCLGQEEPAVDSKKRNSLFECSKVTLAVPLRLEVSHICMNKTGFHFSMSLAIKAIGLFDRARLRMHFGTHIQCTYALLSFGLPSPFLPFTDECELKIDNHKKWIKRRIVKEHVLAGGEIFSCIELPHRNDVLLGKGRPCQNHPGNQRLLELSRAFLNEYTEANNKGGKTIVALKVVQEIFYPSNNSGQHSGARFLQRREDNLDSGWWEEVTDEQVLIAKVSNAFRGIRKQRGKHY
jgi:hypothetical protein